MNLTLQIRILQILMLYLLGYWFVQLNESANQYPEEMISRSVITQTFHF